MEVRVGELIVRPRYSASDGVNPGRGTDWGRDRPVIVHVNDDLIKEIQLHPGYKAWGGRGQSFRWKPTSIDFHLGNGDYMGDAREIEETSVNRPLTRKLLSELSEKICSRLGVELFDVGAYYKKGFTIYVIR